MIVSCKFLAKIFEYIYRKDHDWFQITFNEPAINECKPSINEQLKPLITFGIIYDDSNFVSITVDDYTNDDITDFSNKPLYFNKHNLKTLYMVSKNYINDKLVVEVFDNIINILLVSSKEILNNALLNPIITLEFQNNLIDIIYPPLYNDSITFQQPLNVFLKMLNTFLPNDNETRCIISKNKFTISEVSIAEVYKSYNDQINISLDTFPFLLTILKDFPNIMLNFYISEYLPFIIEAANFRIYLQHN